MTLIRPLAVSSWSWLVWALSTGCADSDPTRVAQTSSSGGASGISNGGAGATATGGTGAGTGAGAGMPSGGSGATTGGSSSGIGGGATGGVGGGELTGYCGVLAGRLRECGLIGPGRYTGCVNLGDAAETCEATCVTMAPCTEISDYFCGLGDSLLGCFGTCIGEAPVSCLDGDSYPFTYRCDGIVDCVEAEDEAGCPPGESVRCRNVNERVDAMLVCDGKPDCSDSSDEPPGCALMFTCADGEPIPAVYACDGFADCLDASDEPADCAVATCL